MSSRFVIPESPKSTLSTEQLSSLMSVVTTELKIKGRDIDRLISSFIVEDDGVGPNTGETVERAEHCKDPHIAIIRAENNCQVINKLTETAIKIRKGDYDDHCSRCGGVIPFERLMCVPVTTKCVVCKEKKS